jgi:hypothetical protein
MGFKHRYAHRKIALWLISVLAAIAACQPQAALPTAEPARTAPTATSTPTPTPTASQTSTHTPVPLNATLSETSGGVDVKQPAQVDFAAAAPPLILQVKGQVRTAEDGRARLDLSTSTILRLAPLTLFTLQANDPAETSLLTRIKLALGQLYILLTGGSVEVETDSGFASVRGSYMLVAIDPLNGDTIIQCLEGTCEARNPSGALTLTGGQGAVLPRFDGSNLPGPPQLFRLSEEDLRQWLEDNPEILSILPDLQATLTAMPPLPTRDGLLPRRDATRTPILPLPTIKPPGILPTKIKPPFPKP